MGVGHLASSASLGRATPDRTAPVARRPPPAFSPAGLQRRFGNQGTAAFLTQVVEGRPAARDTGAAPSRAGSRGAVQDGLARGIYPKLEVGSPADPLEREAERVADRVMRMPAGAACCSPCAGGGNCETPVIRRAPAASALPLEPGLEARVARLSQSGEPLPEDVRADMEPRFGTDFSGVRIHRGADAAESASALRARAWTLGQHVSFAAGQWAPGTPSGDRLIAHELTHTVQARDAGGERPVRRDLFDDLGDAWDSATGAAGEAWDAATGAAGEAWDAATGAASEAWDAASEALSWTLSAVGRLAVAAANAVARRYGGSVELGPDGIVIILPEVSLSDMERVTLSEPPERQFIPVLGVGTVLGPVILIGSIGIPCQGPSLTALIGPARVRNILIRIDPWGDAYSAEGQLYAHAALHSYMQVGAGINVEAIAIIPAGEIPIPVEASVEGGLLLTLNGSAAGALDQLVFLSYADGTIGLDLDTQLRVGGTLAADLNGYINAQIYGFEVCEFIWTIDDSHWEISAARQIDVPISFSYREGDFDAEVGEPETSTIPIEKIETGLQQFRPTSHCLTFDEIIEELCKRGVFPREYCPVPEAKEEKPASRIETPGGVSSPQLGPGTGGPSGLPGPAQQRPKVYLDPGRYPESAAHAKEAIAKGYDVDVSFSPGGSLDRRRRSLARYRAEHGCPDKRQDPPKPGCTGPKQDYDEYPHAMFEENAGAAHVKPIHESDNRGSGKSIQVQCARLPTPKVRIVVAPKPAGSP